MSIDSKIYEKYYNSIIAHEKASDDVKKERNILRLTDYEYERSEQDLKALQTIGQNIGEILKEISHEKYIIKTSHGPRYVVGCAKEINRSLLKMGTRVALDVVTLTITKILPSEVDPTIHMMAEEIDRAPKSHKKDEVFTESRNTGGAEKNKPKLDYNSIGGLDDEIREIREVIELPLKNKEIFRRIGIKPPKGVLLYGPPGTGKTLIAKIVASTMDVTFLKIVASSLIEKYIGESSRMIREIFSYARLKSPCIIFMDEIDAIGGKRSNETTSSDREVQRTLMELLNQLDGFTDLDDVKVIMATNRPDILDPALMRPGRLDRKIEIGLPNEAGRKEILKIHSSKIQKVPTEELIKQGDVESQGDIDLDVLVKMTNDFNGADLRNVCTEAGMIALRVERDYVIQEDFIKAIRKISISKKLESKLDYKK